MDTLFAEWVHAGYILAGSQPGINTKLLPRAKHIRPYPETTIRDGLEDKSKRYCEGVFCYG